MVWVNDFPGTATLTFELVFQLAFQVVVTEIVCKPLVLKLCFIVPAGYPAPESVVLITVPSENLQTQLALALSVTGIPVTMTVLGPKELL